MNTLVLRWRDDSVIEHYWMECKDSDGIDQYDFQSWPYPNQPAGIFNNNIHNLESHYERRIETVPDSIKHPLLQYTSVSKCGSQTSLDSIADCLNNYSSGMNGLPGVGPSWVPFALMNHQTDLGLFGTDEDVVYVLKNDDNPNRRMCIISFAGSETIAGDQMQFLFENAGSTGYCGRHGVHIGVRNELWKITHDQQYQDVIKPALESCHELTCVGHSLGGALCNVFTMCANQGEENLDELDDEGMWDDYYSLAWTKAA